MTVRRYLARGVKIDPKSGLIVVDNLGWTSIIAEVKGWNYLLEEVFDRDYEAATEFYDEIGRFIVEAINEKIQKERNEGK